MPKILLKKKNIKNNTNIVQVKPAPGNPPHISEENSSDNDETNKTDEIEILARPFRNENPLEINSQNENNLNDSNINDDDIENGIITDGEKVNEKPIPIKIKKIMFCSLFKKNLFELHPLLNFGNISQVSPILINHFIFVFNISCIFGFSVLFLNEKRIEKRIYDNSRDSLIYPFKNEFLIILLSILLTMIAIFLIRFYVCKKNKELPSNNTMIKLTIIILMYLSTIFFAFYSILWCLMYYHTQFEWLYIGIWSLFIQWIFLSPIYIFLISLFHFLGNDNCASIMAELNCF